MESQVDTQQYKPEKLKQLCDLMFSHLFSGSYFRGDGRLVNLASTKPTLFASRYHLIDDVHSPGYSNLYNLYYEISTPLNWLHYVRNIDGFTEKEFLDDCHCRAVFKALVNDGVIVRPKPFARNWISAYSQDYKLWDIKVKAYFADK